MDDSQLDRTPNPFSAFAQTKSQSRKNLVSAIKMLIVAVVLFSAVTVAQLSMRKSEMSGLLDGFSTQSSGAKIDQLKQLQAKGVDGIQGIVAAVIDADTAVSDAAVATLMRLDREWMTLPSEELSENRLVVADALVAESNALSDPSDPRHARIQDYARTTARKLLNEPGAKNKQAYVALMKLVKADDRLPPAPVGPQLASSEPLPLQLVDHTDAAWTDWPPTSTRPSLYRSTSVSVDTLNTTDVAMHQSAGDPANGARLLKPQFRVAERLAEQHRSMEEVSDAPPQYWMEQLASGSRWVRMRAVAELGRLGEDAAVAKLREHLSRETDPEIQSLIQQQLDQQIKR